MELTETERLIVEAVGQQELTLSAVVAKVSASGTVSADDARAALWGLTADHVLELTPDLTVRVRPVAGR